ncbi:MAG: PSD1 and planctomycete cytochrome C domain-containing protein [Prosthecobacter sp.]|nr:PSD1 and planctomycete cytochrome C domain-containing protein [Prosthecobacter sp.]
MKRLLPLALMTALPASAAVDFAREVKPILEQHCYSCHGEKKQKSGLRLDVKSAALKGGDYHAPAILPGKAADSPLLKFIRGEDPDILMPPKGPRLTAAEIATLAAWINEGAVWPDGVDSVKLADNRKHWSFQPLPPQKPGSSIDTFIKAKLQENGLTMNPSADRRTLIRRLYLVLHGLPPSVEEVNAFVADPDPRAFEKLVDRLLNSPRYGERWARHWLDVIPFGETHGFEVNTPRENAWPYRDYVIQSFNKDTPYPRFIMEQLAGDTLGMDAATGFIVAAAALLPGQIGKDEESKDKARQDELNDMISGTGGAFLGLTLHCARCHDHKFDPVSQKDYYAIQAIFAGVRHGERPLSSAKFEDAEKEHAELLPKLIAATHRLIQFEPLAGQRVAVHARRNIDRFKPVTTTKVRFAVLATSENNRYEPCLDELEIYSTEGKNAALDAKVVASGSMKSSKHRLEHLNDGHYGNERSWISNTKGTGWVELEFSQPQTIEAVVWGRDRLEKLRDRQIVKYRIEAFADKAWTTIASSADRKAYANEKTQAQMPEPRGITPERVADWHRVRGEIEDLEKRLQSFVSTPMVYAGRFEQPGPTHKLYRGEAAQKREQVTPGAVEAIGAPLHLRADTPEKDRRVAFAKWLGAPKNPLPARVLVNRLWLQHFGEGIVSTPNDFGVNGARPSNPELLDWLAAEFIRGGWSIKHMQRLIVTSAAWQQDSHVPVSSPKDPRTVDAACRLLWRFPPRRLEAEAVRDVMLATAGTLDLRMGGRGYSVFAPNSNYVRVYDPKVEYGPTEWRRMVYQTKVRMAQDSTFGAFDCPDAGQSSPKRSRSTTPLQALNLFNSGFVNQQAALLATRVEKQAGDNISKQVQCAFELAFNRPPAADEAKECEQLTREHGLTALGRVIFNTNEFLFLP